MLFRFDFALCGSKRIKMIEGKYTINMFSNNGDMSGTRSRYVVVMSVGRRGAGGLGPPWIWNFQQKKVVFLVLSGKNQISSLLAPHGKIP